MDTPEVTLNKAKKTLEEKKEFYTQIVAASARYERLLANKDFQDLILDLQNVIEHHDAEIKMYLKMYAMTTSFFKKTRIGEVMAQHQLKRDHIEEGINYPKILVHKGNQAREELAVLKKQEVEETNNG